MKRYVFLVLALGCADTVTTEDLGRDGVITPDTMQADTGDADAMLDTADPGKDVPDSGPKPFLSARKVTKKSDLIGGPHAYGFVGRSYVLENSKARFLLQDEDTAVHNFIAGGSLIDADIKRPAGQPGSDRWHETFPVVGGRVSSVDKVEVVDDGHSGQQAVVRTTGKDVTTGIVPLLDNLAQELGVTIVTDYIIEPDVPWLRIRTEVQNGGDVSVELPIVGDFLAFGGTERVFTPEGGFTGPTYGPLSAIASTGDGVSYAYTLMAGAIEVPEIDVSGTVAFLGHSAVVPAKGHLVFERYLVVGDGDIASVMASVHTIRNEETKAVKGKVQDDAGAALAGARVTFFKAGEATPGKYAVDQAITKANGGFEAHLPPGTYDLVVSAPGRARVVKAGVEAGQTDVTIGLGPEGKVKFEVVEGDDKDPPNVLGHIPAKVSLVPLSGVEPEWAEVDDHGAGVVTFFTPTGEASEHPVVPGHYKVVVSHGPEWDIAEFADVEVKAGEATWIGPEPGKAVMLRHVVDTTGLVAVDLHQHADASLDTPVTPSDHLIEDLAEGLRAAALTDHDMISSYSQAISDLDVGKKFLGITGDEVSYNTVGHFNILAPEGYLFKADGSAGTLYPWVGSKLFSGRTVPELVAECRKIPGVSLVQVNHPRSGLYGYFSFIRFDPVTGLASKDVSKDAPDEPMEWGFDAIEVKGSLGSVTDYLDSSDATISSLAAKGAKEDSIPVMRDFFAWLNLGKAVTATGNSDTSFPAEGSGWPRNLVRMGKVDSLTWSDLMAAIKAQKVVVSNGPVIRVHVAGKERMGIGEVVEPDDGKVRVHLNVQAPPWMDVSSLEVYGNGRPVALVEVGGILIENAKEKDVKFMSTPVPISHTPSGPIVRVDVDIDLFPEADTWYVFVVRGNGDLEPMGRDKPWAFTNPLYVDTDGGGYKGPLQH